MCFWGQGLGEIRGFRSPPSQETLQGPLNKLVMWSRNTRLQTLATEKESISWKELEGRRDQLHFFLLASTDLSGHHKQEKLELRRRGWKRVLETLILSLHRTVIRDSR